MNLDTWKLVFRRDEGQHPYVPENAAFRLAHTKTSCRPVGGAVHLHAEGRNTREAVSCNQAKAAHGANDVPPCLDVGTVPFHRLKFVMSVLHDTVGVLAAFERATVRRHDAIVRRRPFVDKHDEKSSL